MKNQLDGQIQKPEHNSQPGQTQNTNHNLDKHRTQITTWTNIEYKSEEPVHKSQLTPVKHEIASS